jgi:hypothetical protein
VTVTFTATHVVPTLPEAQILILVVPTETPPMTRFDPLIAAVATPVLELLLILYAPEPLIGIVRLCPTIRFGLFCEMEILAGPVDADDCTVTIITLQPKLVAHMVMFVLPALKALTVIWLPEIEAPATEGLLLLFNVKLALIDDIITVFCPTDKVTLV